MSNPLPLPLPPSEVRPTASVEPPRRNKAGNPRLGKETKAEKGRRMGAWRWNNQLACLLAKEIAGEPLETPVPNVHEALGLKSSGVESFFDGVERPKYWR